MQGMKQQTHPSYYRLSEVAKIFNVSYVTIWRWCRDGKVETFTLPSGQRRILSSEVERITSQEEVSSG